MKKLMRCLCLGAPRCGKTSMLLTLNMTENILSRPYIPTIEDTYLIQTGLDTAEKPLEHVTFYDTAGITKDNMELKRSLVQITDWFVLVFSLLNYESFEVVDSLKKYLDKNVLKEKKDSQIVLIGTMADADAKRINSETIQQWATREKVRYFEICTADRASIVEVVHYMVGRQFHAPREPKFSLSKKLKPDRSNAQILMDF
ncbi:unnamed protein product [Bursaphelenchus xylophilus]|uniref:(pine wood nematode) hypothetical protein n=1 Tax=Bursaphelenchus xylophilus TaxID=6326 RepID=A0A7I8XJB5_BURXY|nr:unnamed protein product [Bursaphelenchus xylophilus]CAG9085408.1 unnamed protein product [Bursaphelenchus xylophilus]